MEETLAQIGHRGQKMVSQMLIQSGSKHCPLNPKNKKSVYRSKEHRFQNQENWNAISHFRI